MSQNYPISITINAQPIDLPENHSTLMHAIEKWGARPPFAVAVNTQFVPRAEYQNHILKSGDAVEIISPVTGG